MRHTPQNYGSYFKLQVLNWKKDQDETYQNTAIHFKISSLSLIYILEKRLAEGGLNALFTKRGRPPMNKSPKK
ncbi:helix-turn-helix domain-containing protein [Lactobacillus panisapium]|uniref:Helix-turn-helix domain-containing protein n=1 Tax=Lactobacillus panisapium TaxID=2012495 RepID=A0ABX8WBW9_9LACO|nr:helix-turn-helix domain-containing protein [Lactobacillus panisapium]